MKFKIVLIYLLGVAFRCQGFSRFGVPVLFPSEFVKVEKDIIEPESGNEIEAIDHTTEEPKQLSSFFVNFDQQSFVRSEEPPKKSQINNPLDNEIEIRESFVQKRPPSCVQKSSHDGLCEDDSEYDSDITERFNKALKSINLSEEAYDKVWSKIMTDVHTPVIHNRIGDDIREDPVCPAAERIIFPKRGKTESGDFVFLLNQDNIKQGIKIEECLNLTRSGRFTSGNGDLTCTLTSEAESQSVCRQKYILKNMLAMGPNGSNIVTESILVPSCCVCLRRISANRIGGGNLLEFDENGNLITEAAVNEQSSTNNAYNTKTVPTIYKSYTNFSMMVQP